MQGGGLKGSVKKKRQWRSHGTQSGGLRRSAFVALAVLLIGAIESLRRRR